MNQYDPCTFQIQEGPRPFQTGDSARRLKKLCHEVEETNRLLRFVCFALAQHTYERGGAFDLNSTAMLLGLEAPKRKKRKKSLNSLGMMQGGW